MYVDWLVIQWQVWKDVIILIQLIFIFYHDVECGNFEIIAILLHAFVCCLTSSYVLFL